MAPFGTYIYMCRIRKRMTQKELARLTKIPQSNLSNIEKGKTDITVTTLYRIAHALNEDPRTFLAPVGSASTKDQGYSRKELELIAQAVNSGPDAKIPSSLREIMLYLRAVAPGNRFARKTKRETQLAWLELKTSLSREELNSLISRINKSGQR
jgi:transcriptional regulator with XRE-family HTH domain